MSMSRHFGRAARWTTLLLLAVLCVRAHTGTCDRLTREQLSFLETALRDGAAQRMQRLFPEGYVFTWSLYGLACSQTAATEPPSSAARLHNLAQASLAIQKVMSPEARQTFTRVGALPYGAFYASWSLYLRAVYLRAAGPDAWADPAMANFASDCEVFARALDAGPNPFLCSYPGSAWPADTVPGVAALAIRDACGPAQFAPVIHRWLDKARSHRDSGGLLSHAADPVTGDPEEGVRGESLALMSRLLVDVEPDFAREQYRGLRDHFVDHVAGLPGVREFPRGHPGSADVDSGPLILGFSGPAVVVGAAAARAHGDRAVEHALFGLAETVGLPFTWNGRRRYALGVLPIGDAILAWARSTPRGDSGTASWPHLFPLYDAGLFYTAAALAAFLLLRPDWKSCRGRQPRGSPGITARPGHARPQ